LLGTALAKQFTRLLSNAGLTHRRVHDLRHTAATLMLAADVPLVDVSTILGHSSPEVTARVYAHSFADSRRRAVIAVTQLLIEKEEEKEEGQE
jgi:integrase